MAETKTNTILIGIIGILIVSGVGITFLLTPEQLSKASTCTTNNITGIFERFSNTNKTGYWIDENGTNKQAVCTNGYWIPTIKWLKDNNLTAESVTIKTINASTITEDEIDIIIIGQTIIVNNSRQVSIEGRIYNISYIDRPPQIKCICGKDVCAISDCLK